MRRGARANDDVEKKSWRYLRHTLDNQKADRASDPQRDIEPHLLSDMCGTISADEAALPCDQSQPAFLNSDSASAESKN